MRVAEPPKARVKSAARAIVQVLSALKNSNSPAGPTMTQIVSFIGKSLLKPVTKRQVVTALKRGVDFGILQKRKGHYMVTAVEERPAKLAPAKLAPAKSPRTRSATKQLREAKKRAYEGAARRKRPDPKKLGHVESQYTLAE